MDTTPMRESPKARQAWADYLALGEGRSLEKLLAKYQSDPKAAPTGHLTRLKLWSRQYGWQARLQALADAAAAEAAATIQRRRAEAIQTGLALDYERVLVLKGLATTLLTELTEGGRRWLPDAKWIGGADYGEKVEIERFNAQEVEQLRGLLDDLAKETGGRAKTVKIDLEERVRQMAARRGLDPDTAVTVAQEVRREVAETRHVTGR
jgi:hypothetical protein